MDHNPKQSTVVENHLNLKTTLVNEKIRRFNPYQANDDTIDIGLAGSIALEGVFFVALTSLLSERSAQFPIEIFLILVTVFLITGGMAISLYKKKQSLKDDLNTIREAKNALKQFDKFIALRFHDVEEIRMREEPYIRLLEQLIIDFSNKPDSVDTYLLNQIISQVDNSNSLMEIFSTVLEDLERQVNMYESGNLNITDKSTQIQYKMIEAAYSYIKNSLKSINSQISRLEDGNVNFNQMTGDSNTGDSDLNLTDFN